MFQITVIYADGTSFSFKNINRITVTASSLKDYSGKEIASARIPLGDMWFYTPTDCIAISGTNLLIVRATEQDN